MGVEEEKEEEEEEYGDTPAGRLTQSLLMQTASHRATTNRRRPDSREYRSVVTLTTTVPTPTVRSSGAERTLRHTIAFLSNLLSTPYLRATHLSIDVYGDQIILCTVNSVSSEFFTQAVVCVTSNKSRGIFFTQNMQFMFGVVLGQEMASDLEWVV